MNISKPGDAEYAAFYAGYVAKVPPVGPVTLLNDQIASFDAIRVLSENDGDHRYAEGKWSVKELVGHMVDTERVFGYRLLRIARGDQTPLAGFDENAWAAVAPHGKRPLADVVDELIAVRKATMALVASLDDAALSQTGVANNKAVSARAICWIIPGHAQHHLDILRERYGVML